jgi:cytochrome P450
VSKAFTPRAVEALRPRVQAVVEQLLDQAQDAGSMDLIAGLAYPLPVTVIAELLGIPVEDRRTFRQWADAVSRTLDVNWSQDVYERANQATIEFRRYFQGLVTERRQRLRSSASGTDLISALVAAEEQGDKLSEDELLAACVLLLIAGHETTMNLIGNGTLALLRHPNQYERLKHDTGLVRSAVEELLRYDSPVQMTFRVAFEDIRIGDKVIHGGDDVCVIMGAANRDPQHFANPDQLDIARSENRHMAFGNGIHYCLGAPLARLEGQLAFSTLVRRLPRLTLATEQTQWRENFLLRGLKSLQVTW